MNWKQLSVWIVVVLTFMMGVFFFKFNDPLLNLQRDVIDYLEQSTGLQVEIGEVDFWPLNRLILKDLRIGREGEEVFSAPGVEIYYNIVKLLQDPERWFESLTAVNLREPVFIIEEREKEKEELELEKLIKQIFAEEMIADFTGVKFTARNLNFKYTDPDKLIELSNMDLAIQSYSNGDLEIKLRGDTVIDNFELAGRPIENLQLKNHTLNLTYEDETWRGKLKLSIQDLEQYSQFFPFKGDNYKLEEIDGEGKLLLSFHLQDYELKKYSGRLAINRGRARVDIDDIIEQQQVESIEGEVVFDSGENEVVMRDFSFNFADSPFTLSGSLKLDNNKQPYIRARLKGEKYDLAQPGLNLPQLTAISPVGEANISLFIKGNIEQPGIELDIYLPRGKVAGEEISHFNSRMRYRNDFFYLDEFSLELNLDTRIEAAGVYDLNRDIYNFNLKGENIQISSLKRHFELSRLQGINGKAGFSLVLNGRGQRLADITAHGNMEIFSPRLGNNKFDFLEAGLFFSGDKIVLDDGLLQLDETKMNFAGEIGLKSQELDLDLELEEFKLTDLVRFSDFELPSIKGEGVFQGYITGNLSNPELKGTMTVDQGQIKGNEFTDFQTEIHYQNDKFTLHDLYLASGGARLNGKAEFNFSDREPLVSGEVDILELSFEKLQKVFDRDFPVQGKMDELQMEIDGSLNSPVVRGRGRGEKIELQLIERIFDFDSFNITFEWSRLQHLRLDKLELKRKDMVAEVRGTMEEKLNFDFSLRNFEVSRIIADDNISGLINVTGHLDGKPSNPIVKGNIVLEQPVFDEYPLGKFEGDFHYSNDDLQLTGINWKWNQSDYMCTGIVSRVTEEPVFDLNLKTENGNIGDFLQLAGLDLPIAVDYNLKGRADITGSFDNLEAEVDFTTVAEGVAAGSIGINGKIAEELDLEIQGKGVKIRDGYSAGDLDINLEAAIDLEGKLTGAFRAPDMDLKISSESININQTRLGDIKGQVNLEAGKKLLLEQEVKTPEGGQLLLIGDIILNGEPEVNLSAAIDYWPLSLLGNEFFPALNLDGYIQGEVEVEGEYPRPNLTGKVFASVKEMDVGLDNNITSLTGYIIPDRRQIELSEIKANYGDSSLNLSGRVYPYDDENFWQLELSSNNIPYSRGSIRGLFDPDLEITGSFFTPYIQGDLLVHHTDIILPFSFPKAKKGKEEVLFQPLYELTLLPGKEIYLSNDNLEIMVQEGELVLRNTEGEIDLAGTVRSSEGSFDYYNNMFILEEGRAVFRRFEDNIPDVFAGAYTYSEGVKINITLDGSADNMLTTFSSQPEMTEEEILDLLVRRGGMAEVTGDGEGSVPGFMRRELERFLQETLQMEVVQNLEEKIKKALELDRMEIDTYDLGWNREVTIYLGKDITDNIELEYIRTFGPGSEDSELENELSLRYHFDEDLHLEGSWMGEDDFRIMLEKSLDF